MIDLNLLEQLVAFAKAGSLSAAAEQLHISQPALSKSMKKLEDALGVSLFVRGKNRLSLNATGEYALACAQKQLELAGEMQRMVLEYDRKQRTVSVASCAPVPLWDMTAQLSERFPNSTLSAELKMPAEIETGLQNGWYDLGILPYPLSLPGYTCTFWGEEHLGFSLPEQHPLAGRERLTFRDLDGSKMLVFTHIGFWDEIHRRNMPNTEFLFLEDREMLSAISAMSQIPAFCTDLSLRSTPLPPGRVAVQITDADAHVRFYVVQKKDLSQKHRPSA